MTTHHLYGPSSLQRRLICPGSARMESGLPDTDSDASIEGTRLHAVMAGSDNGEWMDDEQREAVDWCWDRVRTILSDYGHMLREVQLQLLNKQQNVLTFGTPDVIAWKPHQGAHVIDYKFGRADVPAPANNIQMAAYAAMVMQYTGASECTAHVLQPRLHRHESFTFHDCAGIVATIEGIIARCEAPDAPLVPGDEQCKYCKALLSCPAARGECTGLASWDRQTNDLDQFKPELLAALYDKWQVAKRFGSALDARIKEVCREQGSCAGLVLKERAGKRTIEHVADAFWQLQDTLTQAEFLQCAKLSVSQLQDTYMAKHAKRTETGRIKSGEKDRCREEFERILAGLIVQGEPSQYLVKESK